MRKKNRSGRRRKNKNRNVTDRLTALPDDVTGHILSFLPTTKSLVETSTLSKAWRFRWTHATSIAYYRETVPDYSNTLKPDIISSNNNTFHISSPGTTTDSEFESWIITTALRNVRTLFIHLHHHLELPPCLFVSKTLVHLCLVDCGSISARFEVDFPALRKLHLDNVVCEDEKSLPHLLSRCPVLDELIVDGMISNTQDVIRLITIMRNTGLNRRNHEFVIEWHVHKMACPDLSIKWHVRIYA